MRVGGILFRGCVVIAILGSCSTSETRTADYTVQTDKDSIARITGTWTFGDTIIEICDDLSKTFCATDRCTSTPCHDITRDGKAEKVSYETTGSGGGCDGCYGCECFYVRAGVAITARVIRDGRMTNYNGAAIHRGTYQSLDRGWELELYNATLPRAASTAPTRWSISVDRDGGGDGLFVASTSGIYPDRYVKTKAGVCP